MINRRTHFSFLIAASLALGACSMDWPPIGSNRAETSEELLAARGSWQLVEEEKPGSPVNLHMNARSQVDPHSQAKVRQYAKQAAAPNETVHYRVLRLERAVADLRGDFDRLLPPLSSLIVSDEHLDKTIQDIQAGEAQKSVAEREAGARPQPITKPASKPEMDRTEETKRIVSRLVDSAAKKKAVSAAGPASVQSIRMGTHPDKVRIVLDINKPGTYRADIDNNERLFVVELPSTAWSAKTGQSFAKHPLVKGYTVIPADGGGSILAVELKKDSVVLNSMALKPNHKYGHRLVFDLSL